MTVWPRTAPPAPKVIAEGFGGRHAWVHVARGHARVNGRELGEGDGAAISDEPSVVVEGVDPSEVLVFDLA